MVNSKTEYTKIGIPEPGHEFTAQELFDLAVAHLYLQGAPSTRVSEIDGHTECLYRSEVGSCAVGWLIPNSVYEPAIEGVSAWAFLELAYMDDYVHLETHAQDSALFRVGAEEAMAGLARFRHKAHLMPNLVPHENFLGNLQVAHDLWGEGRSVEDGLLDMIEELRQIALQHNLNTSVLTALFPY